MCRKIIMFISLSLLLVACGSSSEAAGPTLAVPTPTTASWNNYTSAEGEFSIAYPPDYTLYQNQVPSVDGVLAEAPNAIALKRLTEPSYVLSIIYRPTGGTLSVADLAALDDPCVASSPSQSLTLSDQAFQALLFKDTPCGPHGSTRIFVNSGTMGYRIMIETQADYQSVEADVNAILDTLLFRVSSESPETLQYQTASCTTPVSFTATDGKISYSGISFEIDPALAKGITAQDCPAVSYREDLDTGAAHPAYTAFTFGDSRPRADFQPELRVYEVSADMSSYVYPLDGLDELQHAATQKPEPPTWFDGAALHVHESYLDFQGGAGVRGVVQYAQDVFFFTNNGLTYAFDGLTQDGRYYVSVRLPLAVPFLMDIKHSDPSTNSNSGAIAIPEWPADYDQQRQVIDAYNQEALRRFNQMADADFTPDLSQLDALVSSIQIGTPGGPSVQEQSILEWEGYGLWGDDDATKCKAMQIDVRSQMKIGNCGETLTTMSLNRSEFSEMVERFGPFEYQSTQDRLTFRGRGQIGGPAWQRAILSWIHWTYAEALTGRACASCRTVLSWHLGSSKVDADLCQHLTVLNFGYAYAELRPCSGGAVQSSNGGWLETGEWEQLDDWLYGRTAVYPGDNYFAGEGSQNMTDAERLQLEDLAQSIYDRFDPQSSLDASDDSAAIEQAMLDSLKGKGAPTENAKIEVQKVADGYARVHVYYDVVNRPGVWDQGFAYLEDGAWKVWAFGSGIAQEHVEAAGIPRSVWPDGWLTASAPRDSCPESAADTRLLTNARHGYCLLYPIEYRLEKPNPSETVLVIGGLLNAQDPRVNIVVEETGGRTAEALAAEVAADVESGFPGFNVERSSITVGGVEAIVLDKLPGQDINRRVFFEHDGLLYELTFFWSGEENAGDSYTRMEVLYEMIVNWFTLIPRSDEVVPGEDCLEAKAEEQLLTYEAHNFCLLYPSGYDVDESTENQIALYVGSLLDIAHPKVLIEVQDAEGRTSEQIAEEVAAEAEAAMPGYDVEVSFGLSLGYEPAWVLENMPGQDISRQVVVVHDGQLYKLTFVPADEQAGEVYTEMEDLYTLLINSFRFLR